MGANKFVKIAALVLAFLVLLVTVKTCSNRGAVEQDVVVEGGWDLLVVTTYCARGRGECVHVQRVFDSLKTVTETHTKNMTKNRIISSPLPGVHNSYNIVAAFAASWALAERTQRPQEAHAVARVVAETKPAFGRGEVIEVDDKRIQLLLAKNPTGVNQNVRTILSNPGKLHLLVVLNDRTADGQDISWIWDVDWEPLDSRLGSLTLGGDRAWDLALRFQYGGFDMDKVKVTPDPAKALDIALAATPTGHTLSALPTYTAMLDLRWVLTQRGYTTAYWSSDE